LRLIKRLGTVADGWIAATTAAATAALRSRIRAAAGFFTATPAATPAGATTSRAAAGTREKALQTGVEQIDAQA